MTEVGNMKDWNTHLTRLAEKLSDTTAENMLLKVKVGELKAELDFNKDQLELYQAKYKAYFLEARRLKQALEEVNEKTEKKKKEMKRKRWKRKKKKRKRRG